MAHQRVTSDKTKKKGYEIIWLPRRQYIRKLNIFFFFKKKNKDKSNILSDEQQQQLRTIVLIFRLKKIHNKTNKKIHKNKRPFRVGSTNNRGRKE